ncbi:MAG: hypothetical protein JST39_15320 [Bacteroidetes bacterium]|nr:hypothetical protein [Bacteroidota bacterium]
MQNLDVFKELRRRYPGIKLIANVLFRISKEEEGLLGEFADAVVIKTGAKTSYIIEVIRKVCELS